MHRSRTETVRCGYVKTADTVEIHSADPAALDPAADPDITEPRASLPRTLSNDGEFQKTASVMKLVVEGYAGAGTISMGGFDYHTGDRATGEVRDLRAGRAWARVSSSPLAAAAADALCLQRRFALLERSRR